MQWIVGGIAIGWRQRGREDVEPRQAVLLDHSVSRQAGGIAFTRMIAAKQAEHLREPGAIGLDQRAHWAPTRALYPGYGGSTPRAPRRGCGVRRLQAERRCDRWLVPASDCPVAACILFGREPRA